MLPLSSGHGESCSSMFACGSSVHQKLHSEIYDKEEDLKFTIELKLISIGTIVVLTPIMLEQHVNLIPSIGLNLVEHVFIHVGSIFVLLVCLIYMLN